MHNAAFAAGNLDYVYVPFSVSSENLEKAVTGLNVLLPVYERSMV